MLKVGPSTDANADFGPLVTKAALEKVQGYVEQASKKARSSSSTAAA